MATTVKTSTQIIGSGGSSATISHGGTPVNSTAVTMTTDLGASIACRVSIGSTAPTVAPTVQFQWSPDGTTYFGDGGPYVVPVSPVSTSYDYTYQPPSDAKSCRVQLVNADTTTDVTSIAYGVSTDSIG